MRAKPDHFHGVIEVLEPMEWSLGDIIQAFKAALHSSEGALIRAIRNMEPAWEKVQGRKFALLQKV